MIFKTISNFNKLLRKLLLGKYRQEKISIQLTKAILNCNSQKKVKILDFGSGYFQPSLANLISKNLKKENIVSQFTCLDFYNKIALEKLNVNENIVYKNLDDLKNINQEFDFCIIADTLHHIDEGVDDLDNLSKVLNTLKQKCKYIIIKDHFEYNFLSRKLLQILDFFGNYQNKTNLPKKYFTKNSFFKLLEKSQLQSISLIENKRYYPWFFLFFNNSKLHFISTLKKNDT